MKRLLPIQTSVEMYRMVEGLLIRVGLETRQISFVVEDIQLLVAVQVGGARYLAIPVCALENEKEQRYILAEDVEELSAAAISWRQKKSAVRAYDDARSRLRALLKPYIVPVRATD